MEDPATENPTGKALRQFYNTGDVLKAPVYSAADASRYLRLSENTLRTWVSGRVSRARTTTRSGAIIRPAQPAPTLLSFINLVEAHVLEALRRQYGISLPRIRRAVEYLEKELHTEHPLATQEMLTDGRSLFVEAAGLQGRQDLINASRYGQLAMRDLVALHLRRIEWDKHGLATRLFPFIGRRPAGEEAPRLIALDPRVSFGRPVIASRGVATAVVAERFQAGESIDDLAEDYGAQPIEIQEAIRCEFQQPRAA